MPQPSIQHLPVFRMTHIDNVPFIVRNGLWSELSEVQDPRFVPIGNPSIIEKRTHKPVGANPPGGVLGEYIPFYFAGRSPMLLNIATGYGVDKVPQKDIVFIVCDAIEIINAGIPYCFTDGNAANRTSTFYNNLYGLQELDWDTIRARMWANNDDDFDRVRKKMAEFLVKEHVPAYLIRGFVVRNTDAEQRLASISGDFLPKCKLKVDTNNDYYYPKYD